MTNGWKGALVGALTALAWAVALTVVADSAEKAAGGPAAQVEETGGEPAAQVVEETEGGAAAQVEEGRALAEAECASCHAVGAGDESPVAEAPAFRDLSARYPVEQLEEALAEGIVTGHADMPEITWEPEQSTAFIAYLKSF
ncbi:cbb3-type cytochrome c oxidase subunit III [Breoghania corrubedonensis]|uniref:Cbb3-type cytochrome c oxidase subunit III n=1 Tax=Breoghania corrubedonensis TaxID=665038 RepID=A0A2T5VDA3_9HYPH|nr:cytochrome c [Breoghania corrubedonensis]PTW61714.1 cbb3-type cytochrome c oxidase subunit III [Breoghania corrubedonensis]